MRELLEAFSFAGPVLSCEPCGNGHINETFRVSCASAGGHKLRQDYIVQRINRNVFRDVEGLMRNIDGVTRFLQDRIEEQGGDPERETLNVVKTRDGNLYFTDRSGECWRSYGYIDGTVCYEQVEKPEDFYRCGKAFGRFQGLLSAYPADNLVETIPGFHDTPARFEALRRAAGEDRCGRAAGAEPEIRFFLEREQEAGAAKLLQREGRLPLRVTHNDTKLNNILFDMETGEGICIIDLDTVMPGLSIFDFGDSIRFGANTAAEDERDLSRVSLSLPLFEAYTSGFLEGCGGNLTPQETEALPLGAKLMTLECGVRFLTDYLEGDRYFKISRDGQNLDRARTQMVLAADMERNRERMCAIIRRYA